MNPLLSSLMASACIGALTAQTNVCTTQVAGTGCGPQLAVSFAPIGGAGNQRITVDGSGLHKGGVGLMAWGQQAINVPLFGCFAYTDFISGHPINPDSVGRWSWSRSWPNSVQAAYRIQLASIGFTATGSLEVTLTDCVVAQCTQ